MKTYWTHTRVYIMLSLSNRNWNVATNKSMWRNSVATFCFRAEQYARPFDNVRTCPAISLVFPLYYSLFITSCSFLFLRVACNQMNNNRYNNSHPCYITYPDRRRRVLSEHVASGEFFTRVPRSRPLPFYFNAR